jgi:signal transduction histidine kinase
VSPAAPLPNGTAVRPGPELVPEWPVDLDTVTPRTGDDATGTPPPTGPGGPVGSSISGPSSSHDDRTRQPWADSQFWVLQFAVLALFLIRLAADVALHLNTTSVELEFSTVVLFAAPAIFAAFRYGIRGALLTSAWITVLAVPRLIVAIDGHDNGAAWAEVTQLLVLDGAALLIGQHVSGRRRVERIAESTRQAHQSAEALYRDLFDSNQAPILIVDGRGAVVEANASAHRVFHRTRSAPGLDRRRTSMDPGGVRLVEMIGPDAAAQILTRLLDSQVARPQVDDAITDEERIEPVPFEVDGQTVFFRPTGTMLNRSAGETRMQVVFEDVTAETRRHDLMEAYATRVVLGQEEERRHLAQELHDGPVQTLIHLCRQIDAVEKDASITVASAQVLADLRIIAEGTVAELRSIARGLRPSILDDLGLVASINQALTDGGTRRGFATTFGVTGEERRLPATVELALYRIAQEAITNVERHASAGAVAVGISFESGGLRLLVKDDGAGFAVVDHPEGDGTHSLGLPGMTERAHLIGSRLVIHSSPGSGTTVDVWVPATVIDSDATSRHG